MARYDRGYDGRGGYRGWDWYDGPGGRGGRGPGGFEGLGRSGGRGNRGGRPWVGGYRPGYQGGSGGIPTSGGGRPPAYDRDYWWLGEHELRRRGQFNRYDEAFERFDRQSRPRYSPVGGTYSAMGGQFAYNRPPRPLRDDTWFSDWTRWF